MFRKIRPNNLDKINRLQSMKKMPIGAIGERDSRINKKNYIQVICIARLLKQKGVIEFIEVAKKFKDQLNKETVKFLLIGEIETHHYDKIDKDYILQAEAGGFINRIPWTDDVKTYLHQSDILFLHSYREGGPRVIIEAAASEIPTVGSDAIGVRDLIINNKTLKLLLNNFH